jgi:acetoin utilization deacetylase AcuC-like enzyme
MKIAYSPDYEFRIGKSSRYPVKQFAKLKRDIESSQLPAPALAEDLKALHSPDYVESVLTGKGPLARVVFGSWSNAYRDACLSMNGGMLLAAGLAMAHGISANLAQGFLHAGPDGGAAECTFNGIALVAHKFPDKKIAVLNCNYDPGVALAEYAERLPNLYHLAICGENARFPTHERSHYLTQDNNEHQNLLMHRALDDVEGLNPDLVIYLAGVEGCDKTMTRDDLKNRDWNVIRDLASEEIPCLILPGGGGAAPMKDQLALVAQTIEVADEIFKEILEEKRHRFFVQHHSGTIVRLDAPDGEGHGFWLTGMTPAELESWWLSQKSFAWPLTPMDIILTETFGEGMPDLSAPVFRGPVSGEFIWASGPLLWKFYREASGSDWYRGHICCDSDSYLKRPDGTYVGHRTRK